LASRPRALIIKPSSLGDIVHALPVASVLTERGFEVHFAARREYRPFLELCPALAEILDFPSRVGESVRFLSSLRRCEYDCVIDLQGLFRSALAGAFSRSRRRLGLPDSREGSLFFYDEIVTYPLGVRHAVDRYRCVLPRLFDGYPLDVPDVPPAPDVRFELNIPSEARDEAARLTGPEAYVVLSPLARRFDKLWPQEAWNQLGRRLFDRGIRMILVGRGSERGDRRAGAGSWSGPWTNLLNRTTIPVLCAVLSRARMCVTVDSAPMHLAAAFSVPVVALFGPTDPAKVGPYSRRRMILRVHGSSHVDLSDLNPSHVTAVVLSELERS